jgi:regulator of extracellular matrix RemA (YlzA/DUF370 family)
MMGTGLIHVGFGNHLAAAHVIAVAPPSAAPIRRLMQEHKAKGMTIDMTSGRRTKAVLFMDDGHVVLAAITPETVAARAFARTAAEPARRSR